MKDVLEWLIEHQEQIIQIVALIAALIATLSQRKEKVQRMGTELMLGAEKLAQTTLLESGPDKMTYVVDNVVDRLPADAKSYLMLVAKARGKSLDKLIQDISQGWYDLAVADVAH